MAFRSGGDRSLKVVIVSLDRPPKWRSGEVLLFEGLVFGSLEYYFLFFFQRRGVALGALGGTRGTLKSWACCG